MVQQEGTAGRDADEPVAHAYDALAVARSVPGTIARQYPLLAIANCCLVADDVNGTEAAHGLAAADEVTAIDHTQRRFWSTTVASAAANVRAHAAIRSTSSPDGGRASSITRSATSRSCSSS